jgi:hypothetical protein
MNRTTRFIGMAAWLSVGVTACTTHRAEPYPLTSQAVRYKCLFNHELLIITHNKTNSVAYIQSFIDKLKDTDVDAVMCCPTAWRTNLFPSEVDPTWKRYRPGQPLSKFPSYDYILCYLHAGGDPVKDTLEACRRCGKDFFISYRMNDQHYVTDPSWPCHNDFWRDHPECWLGDSDTSPYTLKDNVRLFNYMLPPVREYYFTILQELCTNYDVDGIELDFQRFPKFFYAREVVPGTAVMTAFVKRIRDLLNRLGEARGKSLKLCVRVPETLAKCRQAGLDVPGWDAAGLVDMINVSSSYFHTMELDIEAFKVKTKRAKIYGEMNYVTDQRTRPGAEHAFARRYTTLPAYYASALSLFCRGADGLSLFNYDYVPSETRLSLTEGLKGITDVATLRTQPKDYVVTRHFGSLTGKYETSACLFIPDDTKAVAFQHALLRVETRESCAAFPIGVWLNGKPLATATGGDTELFPPVAHNTCYPERDKLKFYVVPLDALIRGANEVRVRTLDPKKRPVLFHSLELALYR